MGERTKNQAWKTKSGYAAYAYVGDEDDAQPKIRGASTTLFYGPLWHIGLLCATILARGVGNPAPDRPAEGLPWQIVQYIVPII